MDERDLSFGPLQARLRAPAAERASLRERVVRVIDQGSLGSCSACAVAQAVRLSHVLQHVEAGLPLDYARSSTRLMSVLWAYYFARAIDHLAHEDAGASLRSLFTGLNRLGFPPEEKWPYSDQTIGTTAPFRRMPAKAAFRAAYDQQDPTIYRRIWSVGDDRHADVRAAISNGFGVCAGWSVSWSFIDGAFDPLTPVDPATTDIAGGHAMVIVGYAPGEYELVNSWGIGWGDNGFFRGNPAWVDEARDLWVVESAPFFSE